MEHKNNNLWWTVLAENNMKYREKQLPQKTLLVLGAPNTGKSKLIAAIPGVKIQTKFQGNVGPLEYAYVNVCEPQNHDALSCINIWLHTDEKIEPSLLNHAVNILNYQHTIVMLVFSLDTPWHWPKQWQQLLKLLKNHMKCLNLTATKSHEIKRCQVQKWLAYASKFESTETLKKLNANQSTKVDLLPEAVLRYNLGLEFIVVVTKSDKFEYLQFEHNYTNAHFNYMQRWLRRSCLEIGAGLIYTSAYAQTNTKLFNNYLMEHFYDLPNDTLPRLIERNEIYIPAGWDNLNKIQLLDEELQMWQQDLTYEEFIIPLNTPYRAEKFIETDEQALFAKYFEEQKSTTKLETNNTKSADTTDELTDFFNNLSRTKNLEVIYSDNFQTVQEAGVSVQTRNAEKYAKDAEQKKTL